MQKFSFPFQSLACPVRLCGKPGVGDRSEIKFFYLLLWIFTKTSRNRKNTDKFSTCFDAMPVTPRLLEIETVFVLFDFC